MKPWKLLTILLLAGALAACVTGQRRVSEPTASVQQLSVGADGSWSIDLRLQNYSSIPMRFESLRFVLSVDGESAGTIEASPAVTIGPESADILGLTLVPSPEGRLHAADALAAGRALPYLLDGTIRAAPDDRGSVREYTVRRDSTLAPVPGLPGVMR